MSLLTLSLAPLLLDILMIALVLAGVEEMAPAHGATGPLFATMDIDMTCSHDLLSGFPHYVFGPDTLGIGLGLSSVPPLAGSPSSWSSRWLASGARYDKVKLLSHSCSTWRES